LVRLDKVRLGKVRLGKVRLGKVRLGNIFEKNPELESHSISLDS